MIFWHPVTFCVTVICLIVCHFLYAILVTFQPVDWNIISSNKQTIYRKYGTRLEHQPSSIFANLCRLITVTLNADWNNSFNNKPFNIVVYLLSVCVPHNSQLRLNNSVIVCLWNAVLLLKIPGLQCGRLRAFWDISKIIPVVSRWVFRRLNIVIVRPRDTAE